jgi:hypothetical protein
MSPNRQLAGVQRRRLTAEQEPFLVARALSTDLQQRLSAASAHARVAPTAVRRERRDDGHGRSHVVDDPSGTRRRDSGGLPACDPYVGRVAMRSLYFPATAAAPAFNGNTCRVISVSPLLRELILRVAELAALDAREAVEARLMSVLMDELEMARVEPLLLRCRRTRAPGGRRSGS